MMIIGTVNKLFKMLSKKLMERGLYMAKCLILITCCFYLVACDQDSTDPTNTDMDSDLAGEDGMRAGNDSGTEAGDDSGTEAGNDEAGTELSANSEAGAEMVDYASVKLNEINSKGEPFDWVELMNLSDQDLDLQGCMLSDKEDELDKYIFPEGVESIVPAQSFLLVLVNPDSTSFALGREEGVYLSDPDGTLIDSITYGSEMSIAGTTYGRLPDGTGDWELLYSESPSAPNTLGTEPVCGDGVCEISESCDDDCIVCGDGVCDIGEECSSDCQLDVPLVINEIVASGTPDGIEVVNIGMEDIDLSTIYLSDDRTVPYKYNLSGMITAGEYLWIEISDETVGFKLKGDEEVYLFDGDGLMIDGVDWEEGDAPEGQSYQRSPDLSGPFVTQSPSPGQANN